MRFDDLFELWMKTKTAEVRDSTAALYRSGWVSLGPKIGQMQIVDFDRQFARYLLGKLIDEGLSVKTARDRMAMVKQMLRFAALELGEKISSTDWNLRFPPSEPRKLQHFTSSEVTHLLRYAHEEILQGRRRALAAMIALFTGMRIGEVCGLKWEDFDWNHNTVSVRRALERFYNPATNKTELVIGPPKTRAGYREIPVVKQLRQILRCAFGRVDKLSGFVVSEDAPAPRNIREGYSRFLTAHNMPDINFHGLRHTYATLLVECGADIKTISTMLGHADVSTTLNLYVHPSLDAKFKAANKAFRKYKLTNNAVKQEGGGK